MSEVAEKPFTLWRGDFEHIDKFRFNRTNAFCHVGQGIYLTDSPRVARTYQDKGAEFWERKQQQLWAGEAKDRLEAYEQAFPAFIEIQERQWLTRAYYEVPHFMDLMKKKWRTKYEEHIESGLVNAQYKTKTVITRGKMTKAVTGVITVSIYDPHKTIGHLSRFDFPREDAGKFFHVTDAMRTWGFWLMLAEEGIVNAPVSSREQWAKDQANKSPVFQEFTTRAQTQLRRLLSKRGILGYEYDGGRTVGGYGFHRAFCLWDDKYVNEHRRRTDGQPWNHA